MDDLLREFLTESSENLLRFEQEIVVLEQRPDDGDLLGSIFRSMHTIKGTCGFLGLARLEAVAHAAENVLGAARDGSLELSNRITSDVLAAADVIREILEGLEAEEEEPAGDDTEVIQRLNGWLTESDDTSDEALDLLFESARAEAAAQTAPPEADETASKESSKESSTRASKKAPKKSPKKPSKKPAKKPAKKPSRKPSKKPPKKAAGKRAKEASTKKAASDEVLPEAASDAKAEPPKAANPPETQPSAASGGASEGRKARGEAQKGSLSDQSLRVDVGVLDRLMNLAGELVLTRNQLIQLSQKEEDSAYLTPVQQLNRVTTDLQEAVMKTRMQPVGNAWGKLPRLVRDLSGASGKKIDLTMLGAETELDRQILQAIRDPLTHMIRNSADHGIELPEERAAAGKSERGEIVLEAFHEGGHIVIEVRDDGRGLDPDRIRAKAVDAGVVAADVAADLPDHRVLEFVFEAGFSTAERVTAVSGRGVGMDVVRRNVEKIGGTVEVHSRPGQGSTFRIKIPLTLAIMSALIVGVRAQSFAIPQIGVLELVHINEGNSHLVEDVNGAMFYRLRDQLLPLVRLDSVLGFRDEREGQGSIVVCQLGASRFGVIVDAIHDTHEIVVKPVGRMVKGVRVYAGTTILGDGRVIMILDVPGIAQAADVLSRGQEQLAGSAIDAEDADARTTALLLFDAGGDAPRAVPLSQVSRLEEFAAADIERADGRWVVQYRGKLLPLVPASDAVQMRAVDPRPVIVFSDGQQSLGLAVERIRDIVQHTLVVEAESTTRGLLGSTVVEGRTTELVDIDYYLSQAWSGRAWSGHRPGKGSARRAGAWSDGHPKGANGHGNGHGNGNGNGNGTGQQHGNGNGQHHDGRRILLVDDSPFFLDMLVPAFREQGFDVTASIDGREALELLKDDAAFDAIVSDIDMPDVDGLELARRIRSEPEFTQLPLIALTSRSSARDRELGMEAGFDHYLLKFDRDEVLSAVRDVIEGAGEDEEIYEEALR